MMIFRCDCRGCNNTDTKLDSLIINKTDGSTETYDICKECLERIRNIIEGTTNIVKEEEQDASETPIVKEEEQDISETPIVNKRKLKGISTIVENYGIDKLKEEYLVKCRSAADIALEIGVEKTALVQYLSRVNITRRKYRDKEKSKSSDVKEGN